MNAERTRTIFSIAVIGMCVILAIIGWFVLPDQVVIQVGTSGKASNTSSKIFALAVPFLVSIGLILLYRKEQSHKFWFALIGPIIYVMTFIMNL